MTKRVEFSATSKLFNAHFLRQYKLLIIDMMPIPSGI
jgi:hypothetical protein